MPRVSTGGQSSKWPMVEFGAYMPDAPPLVNPGMTYAKNIMPRSNGYYGPVRRPANESVNAIAATGQPLRVSGSYHSYKDPVSKTSFHFVGTASNLTAGGRLHRMDDSTGAWDDFSLTDYAVGPEDAWRFANFNNSVCAVFGFGGAPQFMPVGSGGSIFQNLPNAPRAHDIATVREFLVVINVRDDVYGEGFQPYRVWWSAQGDHTNWPDPISAAAASTRSGFVDLFGGGRLLRIIPGIGGADAIIIGERRIWRMSNTGGADIFRFDVVEFDGGTASPGSVAAFNEMTFFYASGFKMFDGATTTPIGLGQVDEDFLEEVEFDVANGNQFAMCSTIDTEHKNVIWSYRSKDAPTPFNDKSIFYNWATGRWGPGEIGFDAMGRLDTARGKTGDPLTFFIGQDFRAQRLTGTPLESVLETKEHSAGGGVLSEVKGIRPVIDAPLVYAQTRTRDRLAQHLVDGPEKQQELDGVVPVNDEEALYYRARVRVPDGEEWTQALGCEFEVGSGGHGLGRAA